MHFTDKLLSKHLLKIHTIISNYSQTNAATQKTIFICRKYSCSRVEILVAISERAEHTWPLYCSSFDALINLWSAHIASWTPEDQLLFFWIFRIWTDEMRWRTFHTAGPQTYIESSFIPTFPLSLSRSPSSRQEPPPVVFILSGVNLWAGGHKDRWCGSSTNWC